MRKGFGKKQMGANAVIYRRNLQRLHRKDDYLMNEEIKSERSEGYYNVSQSDLRFGEKPNV
jgi:hypothetical protein